MKMVCISLDPLPSSYLSSHENISLQFFLYNKNIQSIIVCTLCVILHLIFIGLLYMRKLDCREIKLLA